MNMLSHQQVGIPILGVVENMSGLRQGAAEYTFKRANAQGKEEDITDKVLDLLKQHLGDQVWVIRDTTRGCVMEFVVSD